MSSAIQEQILDLKDKIYGFRNYIKVMDWNLEEKEFHYRCLPQKKKDTQDMLKKLGIILVFMTMFVGVFWYVMIMCFVQIALSGGRGSAFQGIVLLGAIPGSLIGGNLYVRLWISVLKQYSYLLDLKNDEKRLEKEIADLKGRIQDATGKMDACQKQLREKEAVYTEIEVDYKDKLDFNTMRAYAAKRFGEHPKVEKEAIPVDVLFELRRYGYKTIQNIEDDFLAMSGEEYLEKDGTGYSWVFRNLMIIKDCDKYFSEAYKGGFKEVPLSRVEFWKKRGAVDIESYLFEKNIEIVR